MVALLTPTTITTAGTVLGTAFTLRDLSCQSVSAQANFTWGSGGTNVTVYLQTSYDGGTTWADAATFPTFTTSSARAVATAVQGLIAATSATVGDGTLAAATVAPGIFAAMWRVKFVSTGTYAGGTTLRVDTFPNIW